MSKETGSNFPTVLLLELRFDVGLFVEEATNPVNTDIVVTYI